MALDTSRALPAPPSAESRNVPHIRPDRGVQLWEAGGRLRCGGNCTISVCPGAILV